MIAQLIVIVGWMAPVVLLGQNSALAQQLSSGDVAARMEAVSELERRVASDPTTLIDSQVQQAVLILLETENRQVAERLATFLRTGEHRRNEGHAEYYAQVLGLADRLRADRLVATPSLNARLMRALVFGVYNPDSEFAKGLAREGETIVPLVLELAQHPTSFDKWNSYGLIGEMFARRDNGTLIAPLSDSSVTSLRAAARAGLMDPAPDVRTWAVLAVSKARDKDAIPQLERMAKSDPDVDKGPSKYSVRSLAAEALRLLR